MKKIIKLLINIVFLIFILSILSNCSYFEHIKNDIPDNNTIMPSPKLLNISADKTSITGSDTVKIEAAISENNGSSILGVYIVLSNPDKSIQYTLNFHYNAVTEKWEEEMTFDVSHESGTWFVNYILITNVDNIKIEYAVDTNEYPTFYIMHDKEYFTDSGIDALTILKN